MRLWGSPDLVSLPVAVRLLVVEAPERAGAGSGNGAQGSPRARFLRPCCFSWVNFPWIVISLGLIPSFGKVDIVKFFLAPQESGFLRSSSALWKSCFVAADSAASCAGRGGLRLLPVSSGPAAGVHACVRVCLLPVQISVGLSVPGRELLSQGVRGAAARGGQSAFPQQWAGADHTPVSAAFDLRHATWERASPGLIGISLRSEICFPFL